MIVAPLASALDAQGRGDEVAVLLKRGTKYTMAFAYFGAAFIFCLGPDFIRVWMGAAYGPVSGKVLRILAVAQFMSLTELMAAHLLYGLGKHRLNTWYTLIEAALNLGASLILVRSFGIYGVAAGTTLSAIVVRGFMFPAAFLKVFQVRWQDYLTSSILPCIGPTVALVCGVLLMKWLVPIHGYGTLLLSAAAGSALSLPFLWNITLNSSERQRLLQVVANRLRPADHQISVTKSPL
jgi:O-antigen/teichoic acid export membrane protein